MPKIPRGIFSILYYSFVVYLRLTNWGADFSFEHFLTDAMISPDDCDFLWKPVSSCKYYLVLNKLKKRLIIYFTFKNVVIPGW